MNMILGRRNQVLTSPLNLAASVPGSTGVVYSLPHILSTTSSFALLAGGSADLSLSGNQISSAAGIAIGGSEVIYIRETDPANNPHQAVEYVVTLTAIASVPAAPALSLAVGNGQISLSWTDGYNGGSAITAHGLYRGSASGQETLIGKITSAAPFVDTGLTNGVPVYYRLSAFNSAGEGPLSTEQSGTPANNTGRLTMAQIATVDAHKVYNRTTGSGGGQGMGQGTIPLAISNVTAGTFSARCRSAADNSIIQAPWAAGTLTAGQTTVNVSGVDVRLGEFFLDLLDSSGTWQNGTTPVGMGAVFAAMGQSLMEKGFGPTETGVATYASSGITPNPNGRVLAQWVDPSGGNTYTPNIATQTWQLPGDYANNNGPNGLMVGQLLNQLIGELGCNVAIIGFAQGSQPIVNFISGSCWTNFAAVVARAGGSFEGWFFGQGHNDAAYGLPASAYGGGLTMLASKVAAINSNPNFAKYIWSIPTYGSNSFGDAYEANQIRAGAKAWCAANSATYVDMYDFAQLDKVHETQAGGVVMANWMYRATRAQYGKSGGTGPVITSATRVGQVITATVSNVGQTALNLVGSPGNRLYVFPTGSSNQSASVNVNRYLVGSVTSPNATTLTITLSSPVGDADVLDLYMYWPTDSTDPTADNIYDNRVDGDGIATGRILQANATPVTIAAPNASGSRVAPPGGLIAPVSPFVFATVSAPTYGASGLAGFGQMMTGGYARTGGSPGTPLFSPITHECFFVCPAANGLQGIMGGLSGGDWIGVNGNLNLQCDSIGGNATLVAGHTYHVAYVKGPSGTRLYLTDKTAATAPICDAFSTTPVAQQPQSTDWAVRSLSGAMQ